MLISGIHPIRLILRILACVVAALAVLWATLALWIDGPDSRLLAGLLAGGLLSAVIGAITLIRPFRRSLAAVLGLGIAVIVWWSTLTPSNSRDWQSNVAQLPSATLDGSLLTIENVRSFRYRGDEAAAEEHWITTTYDLDELIGFDIFFSYWGPEAYGHTIASWEFSDGSHLAVSIETRKEIGESYSALRGFFRQFELYYVVAEETDVVALRTNHRGERVELYRIFTPGQGDRAMLLDYIRDINELAEKPRWYNALTQNCTTTIWKHAKAVGSKFPLDWRLLANGYVLELAHQLGTVNTSMTLAELKQRSDITKLALQAGDTDDFSTTIRQGLPDRPTVFPTASQQKD
jgi:hypothetical protein